MKALVALWIYYDSSRRKNMQVVVPVVDGPGRVVFRRIDHPPGRGRASRTEAVSAASRPGQDRRQIGAVEVDRGREEPPGLLGGGAVGKILGEEIGGLVGIVVDAPLCSRSHVIVPIHAL